MYADDRVLVGVLRRRKDFEIARRQHWYRIPQSQMPRGIHAEYIAFFLSGRLVRQRRGRIAYFARITGLELVRRRDLLPDEERNADALYYKVQFRQLIPKDPPIRNVSKRARAVSFVHTTWDRFVSADTIPDLYSLADHFTDRIHPAARG